MTGQRIIDIFKPLCEATESIFRPIALRTTDRLHLSLDKTGKKFVARCFGTPITLAPYLWDWEHVTHRKNDEKFPSNTAAFKFFERIPEKEQIHGSGYSKWKLAATDFTALIIHSLWPRHHLSFDVDAKITYDYLLHRFLHQSQAAQTRAQWAIHRSIPDADYIDHPELPLLPYQKVAYSGCVEQEAQALFMEQGTGKTPIVIARICNEARQGDFRLDMAAIAKKTRNFARNAKVDGQAKLEELLKAAKLRTARYREKLLKRINRQKHNRDIILKQQLGEALIETTKDVLGDRADNVKGVNRQAADVMVEGLAKQAFERAKQRAEIRCIAYGDQLEESARRTGEEFKRQLIADATKRAATVRKTAANGDGKRMYRALIVCPKNVRTNWREEFIRFSTVPGKVVVLSGGKLERTKLLIEAFQQDDDCEWTAVVCSYETVSRSWDVFKMIEWDLAVLDESHYIKGTWTKRYEQMLKLRENCTSRMCLTGTPVTNTLMDLFSQLEFLGDGLSGFSSYKKFRWYYGKYVRGESGHETLIGYKNVPLIQERLTRLAFMIRKEEALPDLPEKMPDVVECYMTKEQAAIYEAVRKQLAVEIESDLASSTNKVITVSCILTKLLRLAQITSGFVTYDAKYSDDGVQIGERQVDRFDPNPKLKALVDLLKGKGPNDKTIIWACWIQDIKSIAARLRLEGIDCVTYYGGTNDADRALAVKRFNGDPTCKVFIGNPAAGGTGINLLGYDRENEANDPCNANHVIYYSQTWSMVHRSQSEDRAHRRGTRVPVRYTDLVVPGSIDETIRARVVQKQITAYEIQDVREILTAILDSTLVKGD